MSISLKLNVIYSQFKRPNPVQTSFYSKYKSSTWKANLNHSPNALAMKEKLEESQESDGTGAGGMGQVEVPHFSNSSLPYKRAVHFALIELYASAARRDKIH